MQGYVQARATPRHAACPATVHIWVYGGQAWRQGTWLTAVLWVISLGVHLGYDYLVDGKGSQSGLGSASLLVYSA